MRVVSLLHNRFFLSPSSSSRRHALAWCCLSFFYRWRRSLGRPEAHVFPYAKQHASYSQSTMIHGLSPLNQAVLGTLFTWGLTAAGAALVFVLNSTRVRRRRARRTNSCWLRECSVLPCRCLYRSSSLIAAAFDECAVAQRWHASSYRDLQGRLCLRRSDKWRACGMIAVQLLRAGPRDLIASGRDFCVL